MPSSARATCDRSGRPAPLLPGVRDRRANRSGAMTAPTRLLLSDAELAAKKVAALGRALRMELETSFLLESRRLDATEGALAALADGDLPAARRLTLVQVQLMLARARERERARSRSSPTASGSRRPGRPAHRPGDACRDRTRPRPAPRRRSALPAAAGSRCVGRRGPAARRGGPSRGPARRGQRHLARTLADVADAPPAALLLGMLEPDARTWSVRPARTGRA